MSPHEGAFAADVDRLQDWLLSSGTLTRDARGVGVIEASPVGRPAEASVSAHSVTSTFAVTMAGLMAPIRRRVGPAVQLRSRLLVT